MACGRAAKPYLYCGNDWRAGYPRGGQQQRRDQMRGPAVRDHTGRRLRIARRAGYSNDDGTAAIPLGRPDEVCAIRPCTWIATATVGCTGPSSTTRSTGAETGPSPSDRERRKSSARTYCTIGHSKVDVTQGHAERHQRQVDEVARHVDRNFFASRRMWLHAQTDLIRIQISTYE